MLQLPQVKPEEIKGFANVISRLAELMSLAAFLPVVFRGRMSFTSARTRTAALKATTEQRKQGKKETGKEEKEDKDDAAEEETVEASGAPTGVPCLLLLLASEVLGGRSLLVPVASGSSKDSPVLLTVEKLKSVSKKLQKRHSDLLEKSVVERVSLAVAEVLKTQEVFEAIHSLVMICVAVVALLNAAVALGLPALGQIVMGKRKAPVAPLLLAVCAVPVALFGYGHFASLQKACRSIPQLPAFCGALQHALRVAALVVASDDGTPTTFAMFQAASLLTQISGEVASGRLAQALAPVRAQQDLWSLLDNAGATQALLSLLGTIWLAFAHLRRNSVLLAVMAILSIAASPVTLAVGWPEVSKLLALPPSEASPERGLLPFISVLYAGTAAATLLSGGTVGMLSIMLVLQLLARIHGTETFASLLA